MTTTAVNNHLLRNPAEGIRSTRRTNLQSRRSELNREIHKEIRLRAGVENLIRATSNRSVQQTASLELSFINSHLKLLREQLDDLNGSLDVYQGQNPKTLPMIPLGLKETKDIDFKDVFKDFILEHYSENGDKYEETIESFMELRQAMRRPSRTSAGIQLLLRYLANLYFVERRFFPADRHIGIHFEWYDSITGLPSVQKTITFEKASVLFNLAALYTQIGTKAEADEAIDNYLRGAGILEYIREHFSHPPSFDLCHDLLRCVIELLMVQSHEILLNKQTQEDDSPHQLILNATESAYLSESYTHLLQTFTSPELNDFIPPTWVNLIIIKHHVFKAFANLYLARLLLHKHTELHRNLRRLEEIYVEDDSTITTDIRVPRTEEEEACLGYCHLRMGLTKINDAGRVIRIGRLRSIGLEFVVQHTKEKLLDLMGDKSEEELESYLDPPKIGALTSYSLTISPPDLSCTSGGSSGGNGPLRDPFHDLGPLSFFSAKKSWTCPRRVVLHRKSSGFGISVKGSSPVTIVAVDEPQSNELAAGDVIISINGKDTKWSTHDDVVEVVKRAGQTLHIVVVRPVDQSKNNTMSSRSASPRGGSGFSGVSSSTSSGGSFGRNPITSGSYNNDSSATTLEKLTRSLFRSNRSRSRSKSS